MNRNRRIICALCGAEIQRNTPLEHGGTTMPAPGICPDCEKPAQGATEGHELRVLGLGAYPAAICGCDKWEMTFTHAPGDTRESKLAALVEAHKQHVESLKGTEGA